MSLRIATWNVNSLRPRLDHLARFAREVAPDVICLQETKVTDEEFPRAAVRALGYPHQLIHGQKGYNGVAILSRVAFQSQDTKIWCGKDDRRHAAVTLGYGSGTLELHNFYAPSGGATPDPEANDKFAHKLQFLREMAEWAKETRLGARAAVLVGDLNVAPLEAAISCRPANRSTPGGATATRRPSARTTAGAWTTSWRPRRSRLRSRGSA